MIIIESAQESKQAICSAQSDLTWSLAAKDDHKSDGELVEKVSQL